jgi:hypothetical protein
MWYDGDYFGDFLSEVKDFIQQRNWIDTRKTLNSLSELLNMCKDLGYGDAKFQLCTELLQRFGYSISLGEVTRDLFIHNLNLLVDALSAILVDPKSFLGKNISPYLYLDERNTHIQIRKKFLQALNFTKELYNLRSK